MFETADTNVGGIRRREFLGGALAVGALSTIGVLTGCGTSKSTETTTTAFGTHSWDTAPDPIADSEIVETVDADIIIVGSGISGINAASAAAAAGAKVIVLEQNGTWTPHGAGNGAIGTKTQKAAGIEIDGGEVLTQLSQWGHECIDQNLVRVWIDRSGEVLDEVIALCAAAGVEVSLGAGIRAGLDKLEPYYRQYQTSHGFGDTGTYDQNAVAVGQRSFLSTIVDHATSNGAEFRYSTKGEQLIQDDSGAVTGVIASSDAGYSKFNASKGVILATGDIGGNEEMVKAWCPIWQFTGRSYYSPLNGNMGDGHKMGLWAGAALQTGAAAPMVHALNGALPLACGDLGWLQVNKNGQRFHNEEPNEVSNANSKLTQPGHTTWFLYDGECVDKAGAMLPGGTSLTGAAVVGTGTQDAIDEAVANGLVLKSNTLDDLADQMGIPAKSLKTTIKRYNELAAKGIDDDFSKAEKWIANSAIDTPPFYATEVPLAPFVIPYGLNVNTQSQVCNDGGTPIAGLYAVGNVQGNFFSHDYPLLAPGISHGRAITFGRLVGAALAKGEEF